MEPTGDLKVIKYLLCGDTIILGPSIRLFSLKRFRRDTKGPIAQPNADVALDLISSKNEKFTGEAILSSDAPASLVESTPTSDRKYRLVVAFTLAASWAPDVVGTGPTPSGVILKALANIMVLASNATTTSAFA
ncbi:unnamed protein product [Peronospora belbahrii]|uniref:Uncharacterized protein n=1 Tax=Peronospora belbahrii TaxID=622444 RepID=A0AAU9L8F4_9STRA|nr:unnamed protein product [Peronospora belbahrii]CAH0518810.1 unnamed protein product [Peronospora belbahrii]